MRVEKGMCQGGGDRVGLKLSIRFHREEVLYGVEREGRLFGIFGISER